MPEESIQLFDVNALLALCLTTHQHHRAAHAHLARVTAWATCPTTIASTFRLLLNPNVTGTRRSSDDVTRIVAGFGRDPRWAMLSEVGSLADPLVDTTVLMGHQQVTDLHLVNTAASHGARLATFDAALLTWLAPPDRKHVLLIAP